MTVGGHNAKWTKLCSSEWRLCTFNSAWLFVLSFCPISTKLYGKYGNQGRIQAVVFYGSVPNLNIVMALCNFFNTGPNYGGWKFQNANPTGFIWSEPHIITNKAVVKEYKVTNVWVICQKNKNLVALWNLTWESMGKS